ncbi:WW domain containing protein [Nitzschia inconspicua]|uniref:WW domain containing protein n=1 Tax=Nitzschia inconspicua TaxID=303405 RepID=A0A9K3PZK7_9STRA|nr:WW domain containing protein [Nitzschia inconspicua]
MNNGWVKSVDPKSGRVFYANHITRKTQWDPPEGWVEESTSAPLLRPQTISRDEDDDDEPLPANWEVMHDPTTGKPFYVDHERKITQWTRPKVEKKVVTPISYAPASASTSTTSAAMARILRATGNGGYNASSSSSNLNRSYSQEATYYQHSHSGVSGDVDFSDSMPTLDFSVKKVADKYRLECPHCDALFTLSKRRHHCRLCGDVFCDACSSHRVSLPLPGTEFEKPVRICDFCNKDVEQGNFFSMRRYLTPLTLYDPNTPDDDEDNGVATSSNVNAALCALTSDLDQMVHNAEGFEERVTIPPKVLVPCIVKHLSDKSNTSDRSVRAIASLLSMGSMVGKKDYAHAVYLYGGRKTLDRILQILERSGSDRKTLFVQEQAAQALFYLTDAQILSTLMQKHSELSRNNKDNDDEDELGDLDSLDIQRALRNVLDHASNSKNPNLQRWSAATVRNLVLEDQRRACLAINDVAARVASGEPPSKLEYESLMEQLVSTGGIMILCSLIGADDSDTRAHATAALGATITATRAIDDAFSSLYEMSGGLTGRTDKKDGDIVRAITAGGGCGASVSQLLLSAENSVAKMGCEFLASLVLPLLIDPQGCATLSSQYDCRTDQSGLGACREAALEIASGSCLPALESLVRDIGRTNRPLELRKTAMETLAATVLAVGEMGKAWAGGKYEEGMSAFGAPATLTRAIASLNEEGLVDVALDVLKSSSAQSLGSSNDTPAARIRESGGIILGSLTSCSAEAIMELHSRQVLSALVLAANDASMTAPSTLRGDAAPRCLGMLEAASSVLMFTWQHPSGASSELLDRLIEALDAGAITYLFRVMTSKMDWDSRDRSSGGMKARSAACQLLCCLFGIALTDETAIGMRRLMDACDADQDQRRVTKGPRNIMEAVLTALQNALTQAHKMLAGGVSRGPHYQAALLDLVESSLLATGSMCGSSVAPGGGDGLMIKGDAMLAMRADEFESRRKEVCKVACEVVIRGGRSGPALLPTLLVGGFGEGSVTASLRLALAIAQNGSEEQHSKLALSGLLVPVSDLLRTSLARGDLYKFSAALALVRFCGPYVAAGTSGGVQSVRDAIRVATNVMTLPISPGASMEQIETQEALKSECISALEALSKNAALWSAISTDALPSIVAYLHSSCDPGSGGISLPETRSSALRAVLQIVEVPSHAVAAAEAGLAEPLGRMLKTSNALRAQGHDVDENMQVLAVEVLHVLVSRPMSRRHCGLLSGDTVRAVCAAIGFSTVDQGNVMGRLVLLGLEILHFALADVEASGGGETAVILQSPGAIAFLDAISSEPRCIRSLCATLLLKTDMKITSHDSDDGDSDTMIDVPRLYGPPLLLVNEKCAGFENSHEAAAAILFASSVFACAIESQKSEAFWKHALLQDLHQAQDVSDCLRTSSTFCAIYLRLLTENYVGFVPRSNGGQADYENLTRPLVRYRLLEAMKTSLDELTTESAVGHAQIDVFMLSLLVHFNVPHICLSVWKDPALLEISYGLIKTMVETDPDEVLHLFVESKEAIVSLFDLLNIDQSTDAFIRVSDIQRFLSSTLEKLAQSGMLTEAVEKFDVRSSAIAALAAACLSEKDSSGDDEEEELTSNKLASGLMQTLVELCTVSKTKVDTKSIELSSVEAVSIAKALGKKICQMVITRFLERAKMKQYEIDDDENIMDAPDVAMLCAIAQHDSALQVLRTIGGLHAIAQIAGEGEITALQALQKGCREDPSLLLEAETHASIISLFSPEKEHSHWRHEKRSQVLVETAVFELLAQLCMSTAKGRTAVAQAVDFKNALERGLEIISKALPGSVNRTEEQVVKRSTTENGYGDGEADEDASYASEERNAKEEIAFGLSESSEPEIVDTKLLAAAYSFLSAMTPVPSARDALLENVQFIQTSSALIVDDRDSNLQFAALRAISRLAPYSTGAGGLTFESIGELLEAALTAEPTIPETGNFGWNRNIYHIQATEGLLTVFDSLTPSRQQSVLQQVLHRYAKLLKTHSIAKATRASERSKGGELAYNLTTLIMLGRGKESVANCFDSGLLLSLVNTIQWRYDPKTTITDEAIVDWDATTTHCLQVIAHVLFRGEEALAKDGTKLRTLKENVCMVARPGKAPRKAIDFPSALKLVSRNGEPAAKLAARRILAHFEI